MSHKFTEWAWTIEVKSTPKIVLLALADHSNDNGVCWPSIARISKKTGASKRAIIYALKELQEMGVISTTIRGSEGGGRTSNSYKLNAELIPKSAENAPCKNSTIDNTKSAKNVELSAKIAGLSAKNVELSANSAQEPVKNPTIEPVKNLPSSVSENPNEKKTKKAKSNLLAIENLPEFVEPELWLDWRQSRKEQKKPLTPMAEKQQLAKLKRFNSDGYDVKQIINRSIEGNWQTFYARPEDLISKGGVKKFGDWRDALDEKERRIFAGAI